MGVPIKVECPKCHADRTMLDTSFGVPAVAASPDANPAAPAINPNCAFPIRLILCPRCHYLELYHDVGLDKLSHC